MIIVSDTSPITNLAAIQTLNLLESLYGSIIIPVAVYNELTQVSREKTVPGATEVENILGFKLNKFRIFKKLTKF